MKPFSKIKKPVDQLPLLGNQLDIKNQSNSSLVNRSLQSSEGRIDPSSKRKVKENLGKSLSKHLEDFDLVSHVLYNSDFSTILSFRGTATRYLLLANKLIEAYASGPLQEKAAGSFTWCQIDSLTSESREQCIDRPNTIDSRLGIDMGMRSLMSKEILKAKTKLKEKWDFASKHTGVTIILSIDELVKLFSICNSIDGLVDKLKIKNHQLGLIIKIETVSQWSEASKILLELNNYIKGLDLSTIKIDSSTIADMSVILSKINQFYNLTTLSLGSICQGVILEIPSSLNYIKVLEVSEINGELKVSYPINKPLVFDIQDIHHGAKMGLNCLLRDRFYIENIQGKLFDELHASKNPFKLVVEKIYSQATFNLPEQFSSIVEGHCSLEQEGRYSIDSSKLKMDDEIIDMEPFGLFEGSITIKQLKILNENLKRTELPLICRCLEAIVDSCCQCLAMVAKASCFFLIVGFLFWFGYNLFIAPMIPPHNGTLPPHTSPGFRT